MKAISVTCIICGTAVFIAPMLHQVATFAFCAYAVANTHLSPFSINPPSLVDGYHIASLGFGVLLTIVGIVFGVLSWRVPAATAVRPSVPPAPVEPTNA